MSILQRESNKGSKERHGPNLGVCFTVLSAKRESTVCSFLIRLHFCLRACPHESGHFGNRVFFFYKFYPRGFLWTALSTTSVERFKEDEVSVSRFTGIVWTASQFVQQNVQFQTQKMYQKLGLNKLQLQLKA